MSFRSLLNRSLAVRRNTSLVLDSVTMAAAITVDRQPVKKASMFVTIAGASHPGIVTVHGTVAGTTESENVSFVKDGSVPGIKLFTNIAGFSISGFSSNGTINVEAVTKTGRPLTQEVVVSTIRGRVGRPQSFSNVDQPGELGREEPTLYCLPDVVLLLGDVIVDGSNRYQIDNPPKLVFGKRIAHHYEAALRLL